MSRATVGRSDSSAARATRNPSRPALQNGADWARTSTAFGRSILPIGQPSQPQPAATPGRTSRPKLVLAGTLLVASIVSVGAFALVGGTLPPPAATGTAGSGSPEVDLANTAATGAPSLILGRSASDLPAVKVDDLPAAKGTGSWAVVQRVDAYRAKFPKQRNCPTPKKLKSWSAYQKFTTRQLACVQAAWAPTLDAYQLSSATLPHSYYRGSSATSACGKSTAPAFYCSADGGRIYFGGTGYKAGRWWKLSTATTVMHEYGHHLQALFGILDVRYDLDPKAETTRRIELQATCLAWGMLRRQSSYKLTSKSYSELIALTIATVEDGSHGSKSLNKYWATRGFFRTKLDTCNTWVVNSSYVKAYS